MTPPVLGGRDNLVDRKSESWRPPVFGKADGKWASLTSWGRRFLDLQASSIWMDLKLVLPACQGSVLDVGCGAQPYRRLLPTSVHYAGIDTEDAQAHFGYRIPDTSYFQGDTWPVASGSIDTVIATETLEHVACPEKFLAEAKRVLKSDGWLVLTVPFAARWHYIPHDYWRFTPSGLSQVMANAGLRVPIVYARGNEVTVACYKVMALILMLLLGKWPARTTQVAACLTGVLLLPLLLCLAIVGQISLRSRGGNDCLGYTAIVSLVDNSTGTL
jgi:SAM-dependent methyltransferase